eukprot:scaffold35442_cov36-Tisochrysis_lutea.AAC.1
MDPEKMAQQMAGGRGGRPKRRTRGQWKRELIAFYESHGLQDKIAGVDAALDKWKGREQKMWDALQTKCDGSSCVAWLPRFHLPHAQPIGFSLAAVTPASSPSD